MYRGTRNSSDKAMCDPTFSETRVSMPFSEYLVHCADTFSWVIFSRSEKSPGLSVSLFDFEELCFHMKAKYTSATARVIGNGGCGHDYHDVISSCFEVVPSLVLSEIDGVSLLLPACGLCVIEYGSILTSLQVMALLSTSFSDPTSVRSSEIIVIPHELQ